MPSRRPWLAVASFLLVGATACGTPATPTEAAGAAALRAALLSAADVPDGFTPTPAPPVEKHGGDPARCVRVLDDLEVSSASTDDVAEARVVFATPGAFAMIQEVIRRYPAGRAAAVLSATADTLAGCPEFTVSYADGSVLTGTVRVVTSSEDRLAGVVTVRATGFTLSENLMVRRVGDILVVLGHTGPEPSDLARTSALMERALDRLAHTDVPD
jgi:hypothetical protein